MDEAARGADDHDRRCLLEQRNGSCGEGSRAVGGENTRRARAGSASQSLTAKSAETQRSAGAERGVTKSLKACENGPKRKKMDVREIKDIFGLTDTFPRQEGMSPSDRSACGPTVGSVAPMGKEADVNRVVS